MTKLPGGHLATGLVLMGGGARGAYQVGVLKGVGEITHELGVRQPFPIITGVSAGGLNACHLAAYADDMRASIQQLVHQWATLRTEHVFRVDLWSLAKIAGRGLLELLLGGLIRKKQLVKRSLLDTTPLQEFAKTGVPWERIQQNVDQHHLHSLALTAVSYTDGTSHTFFQGHPEIESWERLLRTSERTILEPRHLLASSAIPLLFSPVLMDGGYFGDGSLRNYHPLSPAIQCGADRLLVVGVRRPLVRVPPPPEGGLEASPARVISVLLNSIFLDAIDTDYDQLKRINKLIENLSPEKREGLRPIKVCIVRPSENLGAVAAEMADEMPAVIRHFVAGLGSRSEASDLISYLLFEPCFTHWLMDLGYRDVMAQRDEIVEFYSS